MKRCLWSRLGELLKQPALTLGEVLALIALIGGLWLGTLLLLPSTPVAAQDDEQMLRDFGLLPPRPPVVEAVPVIWDGAPVSVPLTVRVERRLIFPAVFRLGLEPAMASALEHEIYDRYLLLKALRPLTTRARVQLESGEVFLLDLQAVTGDEAAPSRPLVIRLTDKTAESMIEEPAPSPVGPFTPPPQPPGYIDLVRFAAQRMTVPERLWTDRPGRVAVTLEQHPYRLLRSTPVLTTPVASWEEAGLTVTAVRVQNEWDRSVLLDPRQVVGHWRAAAFQHSRLPVGGTTYLYLISDVPFLEALGSWQTIRQPTAEAGDP